MKTKLPFPKRVERYNAICALIQTKSPADIAKSYGISEKSVKRILKSPPRKRQPKPLPNTLACRVCHVVYPINEFYSRTKGGIMKECRECNKNIVIRNNIRRWVKRNGIKSLQDRINRHQELLKLMSEVLNENTQLPKMRS